MIFFFSFGVGVEVVIANITKIYSSCDISRNKLSHFKNIVVIF